MIEATVDTPGIALDPKNSRLEISGKSYPEDTREFYGPVLEWVDRYVATSPANTTCIFKLKYFNSSSYKPIFDILTKLDSIRNGKVQVEWHYKNGDIDMKESGEEFADLVDLPFSFHTF